MAQVTVKSFRARDGPLFFGGVGVLGDFLGHDFFPHLQAVHGFIRSAIEPGECKALAQFFFHGSP